MYCFHRGSLGLYCFGDCVKDACLGIARENQKEAFARGRGVISCNLVYFTAVEPAVCSVKVGVLFIYIFML